MDDLIDIRSRSIVDLTADTEPEVSQNSSSAELLIGPGHLDWDDLLEAFNQAEAAEPDQIIKIQSYGPPEIVKVDPQESPEDAAANLAIKKDHSLMTTTPVDWMQDPEAFEVLPEFPTILEQGDDNAEVQASKALLESHSKTTKRPRSSESDEDIGSQPKVAQKSRHSALDARGHIKQAYLKNDSSSRQAFTEHLRPPDIFADATEMQDAQSQPVFSHGISRREEALDQLAGARGGRSADDHADDRRILNQACSPFGRGQIRPDKKGGSGWTVLGLESSLKPHQVIGTGFMLTQERKDSGARGGILADQMGLGKTVTALALINNKSPSRPPEHGPTLVVAPAGVIRQWKREIGRHCVNDGKRYSVGTYTIFRASAEKDKIAPNNPPSAILQSYHIVITTYAQVIKSFPSDEPPDDLCLEAAEAWRQQNHEARKGILHHTKFHRLILDEAHVVRNPQTSLYRAIRALRYECCWSLTGTPFVNGPYDLYNLLVLAGVNVGMTYATFKGKYRRAPNVKDVKAFMKLVRTCMVRRTHRTLLFGARLITLPPTVAYKIRLSFTPIEREIYDIVEKRFRDKIQELMDEGDDKGAGRIALIMIVRLRQLTAHPLILHQNLLELLEREDIERLKEVISKQRNHLRGTGTAILRKLTATLEDAGRKRRTGPQIVLDGPIVEDLEEDCALLGTKDTGKHHGKRQRWDSFIENAENAEAVQRIASVIEENRCADCGGRARQPQITSCVHILCKTCLEDIQAEAAQAGLDRAECPACESVFERVEAVDAEFAERCGFGKKQKTGVNQLGIDLHDLMGDDGRFMPSTKTFALKAGILHYQKRYPDAKIIVYSQWLLMLRIMESICEAEKWTFITYHGQMTAGKRDQVVEKFEKDTSIKILLCSLQAGGVGINLTMASRVICIDQWWNNAVEQQAFSRCYRIGQEKETSLLQLYVRNTIDERMQEIKKRKQDSINKVAGVGEDFDNKLTKNDMLLLLGVPKEQIKRNDDESDDESDDDDDNDDVQNDDEGNDSD